MKGYAEIKVMFENRKTNNKTVGEVVSEIQFEKLNKEDIKEIINSILLAKDKTTEDLKFLVSKFGSFTIEICLCHYMYC